VYAYPTPHAVRFVLEIHQARKLTWKRTQKFMREGCPNCEHILGLRGNSDAIQECTSQVFEGLIMVADERNSWVARWQRLEGYVPGTYAVKVTGSVRFPSFQEDGQK
jgi:RNA polymerase subunit RPABC4/transcription elongation factor Spt4